MAILACKSAAAFLPMRQASSFSWSTARAATAPLVVTPLAAGTEDEVLSALSAQSLTNVIMSGFIRDNGLASPLNRGRFYACRNERDKLEGIALIGHTILFEAFNEGAIQAFAAVAHQVASPHLLMGDHNAVQRFWNYYAGKEQSPRLLHPVIFLQRREPFKEHHPIPGLRQAMREDLKHVIIAQAAMALETSGVDPLKKDPTGFRERYLRRIEKKRVWVLMKDGRLIFKTDVIAETPEATYIEGVYVTPEERGKGLGRNCLLGLGRLFLERTKAIYLFVEHENRQVWSFYANLGFSDGGRYDLLYF